MVILGKWKNQSVTLSIKPNTLTISLDGSEGPRVLSYDLCGRLWTAMLRQVSYRRGLDGKVVAKWIAENGQRDRRWLPVEECRQLLIEAVEITSNLLLAIQRGEATLSPTLQPAEQVLLEKAAAFSPNQAARDADHYRAIYKPVGILPPDQYMAVVLQLTEGCAFNSCTFCTFYRDRPFRTKKLPEFAVHIQAISEVLGEGLSLRRAVFLCGGPSFLPICRCRRRG
ncbi:hypothetical protein FDZ73_22310 [bacterium]|nr:MAG: hypothetical protein FDZ73_22310 [bacterium]